jgi:CMP-N-acetylneuraminic acid synthetase
MNRYAVLLPIKDHSERVPGKNFRDFCGKPLWAHVVEALSAVEQVGAIFINTDSERFTPEVLALYPKVTILKRPEELRGDFVSTNKLFAWDLTQIPEGYSGFLQTHTTNPLLLPETIVRMIEEFEEKSAQGECDSLFTVNEYYGRFYHRNGKSINHDPKVLLRTQDLDPLMEENSNLYLFTRESFARTGARIGERPMMFPMNRLESVDIDDQETWDLAELIMASRHKEGIE